MKKFYELGKALDDQTAFRLTEEVLNLHAVLLGPTGSGKSRLLRQLLREHLRTGRGFCLVDFGDLADDLLADIARQSMKKKSESILHRVHFVELSPFRCMGYNPFQFLYQKTIAPELFHSAQLSWHHTKVQSVAEIFQIKQGQSFEGMPRLHRVLTDILTAVSVYVEGRQLTIPDAQILLDLTHPLHYQLYEKIAPHLPQPVRADFAVLHSFKRVEDLRRETESTINRLRALLGPCLTSMLSFDGPSIVIPKIIQRGQILLVKVQQSPFVSHEQNVSLAKMIVHDVIEAALNMPREMRRNFTLVIDEAHEVCDPSVPRAMRILRKYGTGLILSTPDLRSLRSADEDLAAEILGVARSLICFGASWPEDVELLARILGTGHLCFEELMIEVERHAGYEWKKIIEISQSLNAQSNWSEQHSEAQGNSESLTRTESHSQQRNWSQSSTQGNTIGNSASESNSSSQSNGQSTRESPILSGKRVYQMLPLSTSQTNRSGSRSISSSQNQSSSQSKSQQQGGGEGVSKGLSIGEVRSENQSDSSGQGGSLGTGMTLSHRQVPLAQVTLQQQHTGKLKRSVSDQLEELRQKIMTPKQRQAWVKLPDLDRSILIEVGEVNDPFRSSTVHANAVEWIKDELAKIHEYCFVPNLNPAEQERRLLAFLSGESVSHDSTAIYAISLDSEREQSKSSGAKSCEDPEENPLA